LKRRGIHDVVKDVFEGAGHRVAVIARSEGLKVPNLRRSASLHEEKWEEGEEMVWGRKWMLRRWAVVRRR
jgi:hypothetical protein